LRGGETGLGAQCAAGLVPERLSCPNVAQGQDGGGAHVQSDAIGSGACDVASKRAEDGAGLWAVVLMERRKWK
jgi:hypothetical protein